MKSILFVDDDQQLLDGLKRGLRSMRKEWSMTFANGGEDALKLIDSEQFDVIVSDAKMPNVNGLAVLSFAKETSAESIRIFLTGELGGEICEEEASSVASKILSKPCDTAAIQQAITEALSQAGK